MRTASDVGKVIPTCLALVLCDSVKRPTRAGEPSVLRAFEFVPPGDLDAVEIITVRFSVFFQDPNAVVEHEAVFDNGLVFEHDGRYRVRVIANGVQIMQRNFGVFSGTP